MKEQAAKSLHGGVAVITGTDSGIGEGLARHAAELGMKVVLADVATDRSNQVAAQIRAAGGEALTVTPMSASPRPSRGWQHKRMSATAMCAC